MSFRGRPSRGCAKCRARKIKCDESLPACRRCVKGGFECQYRDSFDLFFRNQTTEVAQKAQEKWRSRAKKPQSPQTPQTPSQSSLSHQDVVSPISDTTESRSDSSYFGDSPISPINHSQITFPLNQQMTLIPLRNTHAQHRFFFDFACPLDSVSQRDNAFLGFLPKMYETTKPDSALYHSLSAAALANFAGRYKAQEAKLAAADSYGKALKRLATSMSNPASVNPQESLVAICLLGLYELVHSGEMEKINHWVAHTDGAVALITISNMHQAGLGDKTAVAIYFWIFSQMLIKALSDGTMPTLPLPPENFFPSGYKSQYLLLSVMNDVAMFCATWKARSLEFLQNMTYDIQLVQSLIEQGQALDARLEVYGVELPEDICFTKVLCSNVPQTYWLRELLSAPGAPQYMHKYKNLMSVGGWNQYRTTRLILNGNLLEICKSLFEVCGIDYSQLYRKAEQKVIFCVDEICEATIANFSGHLDDIPEPDSTLDVPGMRGYTLIWPLFIAGMYIKWAGNQTLDVNNRAQWIRDALTFVHKELAISKAAAFLETIDNGLPSWYDNARRELAEQAFSNPTTPFTEVDSATLNFARATLVA